MKLTAKINLALAGAFVVGVGVASVGAHKFLADSAIESSARDARIVMEAASAVRSYTAESISPLLQQQMKVQFLPILRSPRFAAQTNARLVQKKLPDYSFLENTLNTTNVYDRAADWEAEIFNDFRNNLEKRRKRPRFATARTALS